jgi:hypothetical protein
MVKAEDHQENTRYLQVEQLFQKLRTTNPGKIYDFDPTVNSLVMDQAQQFVERHDVPVVYEPNKNFPEVYLSERLITRAQCRGIKKIHRIAFPHSVYISTASSKKAFAY